MVACLIAEGRLRPAKLTLAEFLADRGPLTGPATRDVSDAILLVRASLRLHRRDIEAWLVDSIRRATALMQACLLREVGFDAGKRSELLEKHLRSWPIPSDVRRS